jgi:hypothetical protein
LVNLRANQKLGQPGVKTAPLANGHNLEVLLPERVLDFTSEPIETPKVVIDYLPKDTSYGQRRYLGPDGFWVSANVVLMGADRTSIHKPEFCLPGQGWRIDEKSKVNVPIDGPRPYQLPVMKWVMTNFLETEAGQKKEFRGLYVFWFVADGEQTANANQRMWWMARDLLRTGVLQRWAYVSYFAVCTPGQEEPAFERMKKLIAASVPEFQRMPGAEEQTASVRP